MLINLFLCLGLDVSEYVKQVINLGGISATSILNVLRGWLALGFYSKRHAIKFKGVQ